MLFGVQRCVESRCLTRSDQTHGIPSIAVKIVSHVKTAYVITMFELGMDSRKYYFVDCIAKDLCVMLYSILLYMLDKTDIRYMKYKLYYTL